MQSDAAGSRITGFGQHDQLQRLALLAERAGLSRDETTALLDAEPLAFSTADHMIENAVGVLGVPLGVGLNFRVNGGDRLVPMAVEEPSVVAAASFGARLARAGGGFTADADPPVMIGQVQLLRVPDLAAARAAIERSAEALTRAANAVHPNMVLRGGGMRGLEVRTFDDTAVGAMLVVHLLVDVGDAMGANAVNTMAEAIAPELARLAGGEVRLRILSNLADRRRARAHCRIPVGMLDTDGLAGREVAERIVEAWALADADPYRATTHNKGIMNGIDAVALACGQDWRSIEAGAHAFAARDGRYRSLTRWRVVDGALCGSIELPLAVATVGGNLDCNPRARFSLRLLGVRGARDLASVMAAVGLAQNLAAVRALVTDGIQRGHMALHARGLAHSIGAPAALHDALVARLVASGDVKPLKAREILAELQAAHGVAA